MTKPYAPLVRVIVHRKIGELPASCEVDDPVSAGLEALIKSPDRYDPVKAATLEQFAWTRIHGAVIDELRRGDWAAPARRRQPGASGLRACASSFSRR